jgi:putative MATE family efflux protein
MTEKKTPSVRPDQSTWGVQTLLGNPKKAIVKLSLPMIAAMSLQTLYSLVDALWVSGLGPDALSAVGFFVPFMFMMIALSTGLGVGGGAAISRRIGAGDKAGSDQVATTAMVLMLISSLVFTLPFFILASRIFTAMGAGPVTPLATSYARIIFAGTLLFFFSNVVGSLLRAEGDVKRAMYAIVLGSALNIVLDPIFIYTLKLGVPGAAWATLISAGVSALFLFYWTCIKKDTYVAFCLRGFTFAKNILNDILKVGIPASFQQLAMALTAFFFNLIAVKVGGTDGVAIYTTGWRVVMVGVLPLIGIAMAVVSVTGAAFGAKDYKKLDTAWRYAVKIGFFIELAVAALTFLFAHQIAWLFTSTAEGLRIRAEMVNFLRISCVFYPTVSFGMLSSSMFQGTGKGVNALIVTVFRTILLAVPLAYLFAIVLKWNLTGLWWGIVAGNISGALIAFTWARIYVNSLKNKPQPATSVI